MGTGRESGLRRRPSDAEALQWHGGRKVPARGRQLGGGEEITPNDYTILEQATVQERECQEMNPGAFDYCEDMASLTHLNEASVLYNLRARFNLDLIHVKSRSFSQGIFVCFADVLRPLLRYH